MKLNQVIPLMVTVLFKTIPLFIYKNQLFVSIDAICDNLCLDNNFEKDSIRQGTYISCVMGLNGRTFECISIDSLTDWLNTIDAEFDTDETVKCPPLLLRYYQEHLVSKIKEGYIRLVRLKMLTFAGGDRR